MTSSPFYSDILARDMTLLDAAQELEAIRLALHRLYPDAIAGGAITTARATEQYTALTVALAHLLELERQLKTAKQHQAVN